MAEETAEETIETLEPSQAVEAQEAEEEPEIPEWITTEQIKGEPFDATEPSQALEVEEDEEEAELPEWVSAEEVPEETVVASAPSQELEVVEAEEEPEIPEWFTTEEEAEEVAEVVDESEQDKPIETAVTPKQVEEKSMEEAVEREILSPINLNTASFKTLERLPSIGPVTAQTIIDHRETHGFFKDVDSIQDVPGIGPKTLETLRDFLHVEQEVEITPIPSSREEKTLNEGRSALESGNISKAYDHYSKLIEEEQLLESVIDDLKEAQYRFPVEVSIYELLGDAYMHTDQLQEAIDTYTKAEELLA
jgi:competence ComEA-like helix-hairpin-helix protein